MTLNGKSAIGSCYVSARLDLLGIDWIGKLGLWDVPFSQLCNNVTSHAAPDSLSSQAQQEFPELFAEGLGRCTKTKVSLTLKQGAQKVFRKARPVAFAAMATIEEEISRQLHLGVFTPISFSDFAAPIVTVKKKNGKTRICGDYSTGLNDALEPNKFPLPTPDEIFANLAGKRVFSKIDLSDAFLQVELDDDAKRLLVVNTHLGLFQVNRMQPGVKTAPGQFQELMTKMLSGVSGAFAFIDDIIVSGSDIEDHKRNLFEVLRRINDYGFKLRIDKCSFGESKIQFCGHIIDKYGVRPDPAHVTSILEMPRPEDLSQLRSFLGAIKYYGKFIKDMKDLRGPLDELTKNDVKFDWQPRHEAAFKALKEILGSDLVLTHYDPNKPIVVAADCSGYGKGGAIMHRFEDGSLHPIQHCSQSLNAAEKNYSQIHREATAIVFAVKRFHKYIYGRKFELQTDHKPLLAIFGSKEGIPVYSANRLQRYALTLLAYDFDIKYVDTASFGYVDALSRLIAKHPREDKDVVIATILSGEEPQCFAVDTANMLPISFSDIQQATLASPGLKKIVKCIELDRWPQRKSQLMNKEAEAFFEYRYRLTVNENAIFMDNRVVIPNQFRKTILAELHNGHPGDTRMKLLARSKVYWPGITKDIEDTVKSCETCAKVPKNTTKCTLAAWPIATAPMSRLHADYAGPINGNYFLVIVDSFSNWPEVFKTTTTTSAKTIELFKEAFARNGLCKTLVTDNGPQFASKEFDIFCKSNGIKHIFSPPYHPQSNGRAEKFVDILKTGLTKAEGNADEKLRDFLYTYRFMPCYRLGNKSPSELMNCRTMNTRLDLLHPKSQLPTKHNTRMEQQFNIAHGARPKTFDVGSTVYYQLHKSNDLWQWVSAIITHRHGTVNYALRLESGRIIKNAHANQLKTRYPNEISDAFGLSAVPDVEIEATITPDQAPSDAQAERNNEDSLTDANDTANSSNFEDALDDTIVGDQFVEPEFRRSTRTNFGVPAQRYMYDE